jgi:hypothetical protein
MDVENHFVCEILFRVIIFNLVKTNIKKYIIVYCETSLERS